MASLTVWKFDTAEGAGGALDTIAGLAKQQLIQVQDAAVVTWPADKKKPKTKQAHNLAGAGALGGAFWGMLFGLLFLVPFFGMALGAAMGAIAGHFTDYGIDDDFIKAVKAKVTPGTSALFVLSDGAVVDKVTEAFKGYNMELIQSNLSEEQEAALRQAFGEE
jgi:uncharacterized membrane protein